MGVDELLERVRARRRLPPAGERRRIREAAGVSQHEVAKALGVSWTAVYRWEQGSRPREHEAAYNVEFDEGPTAYGDKPILVLEVDGEKRSVWLLETALQSRFADEVRKRPTGDLTPGERIIIHRGEMVRSGTGRDYRSFKVRFPDRPKREAAEIIGAPTLEPEVIENERG
jgi:transcriptional regulator with XRE-family HTH domain